MSLKFFADQCVPRSVIQELRDAGNEVLRLGDYIPVDSPDPLVISKSQELDAILLSLDSDFADIVTYPPAGYKGIVALQVRNHPEIVPQLMQRLLSYLSAHRYAEHYRGKLFIAEAHRIRIRA